MIATVTAASDISGAFTVSQALFSLEGDMATPPVFLLENSVDRGNWWGAVHGVAKSQTGRSMHAQVLFYLLYIPHLILILQLRKTEAQRD